MMRRFSRRKKSGAESGRSTIDAAASMAKILETGLIEAKSLEAVSDSGIPDSLAAIGRGQRTDGSAFSVAYSPRSATEALLGALVASSPEAEGAAGPMLVVAPQWPAGARRILSLMGRSADRIEAIAAPVLSEARVVVEAEPEAPMLAADAGQLAARMVSSESRAAFRRGAAALEGLAAKHGGSVRVGTDRLELVVLARRAASLRTEGDGALLEIQIGGKTTTPLSGADLAGALDGLEGQIRRRLNDRKVREGEEGLRGRIVAQLAASDELRGLRAWPQPGTDLDDVDAVAVSVTGEPVVIAVREEFDWRSLAAVLESVGPLQALFPVLFADIAPPLKLGVPRLLLVAKRFSEGLEKALGLLTLAYELREVSADAAGPNLGLSERSSGEGAEARPAARRGRRRGGRSGRGNAEERDNHEERGDSEGRGEGEGRSGRSRRSAGRAESGVPRGPRALLDAPDDAIPAGPKADLDESDGVTASRTDEDREGDGERNRGRRRRRSRRGRGGASEAAEAEGVSSRDSGRSGDKSEDKESAEGDGGEESSRRRSRRFEEVSLMDLDEGREREESSEDSGRGRSRRGRGRGKGRGRSRRGGESGDENGLLAEGAGSDEDSASSARVEEEDLVDSDDLEEILARLADDGADFEPAESSELKYEDEDEASEEEGGADNRRLEAEKRRRARKGGGDESDEDRPATRRRSAIVVHGDRDSVLTAMLLARDIRQLDGIWVFPQSELMTFFRSVATDLRDETPILMIGFSPSPARDVVQASALYRGRLTWFDRQAWPPEDRLALAESLGEDAVCGGVESDSSLPLVLETCSRRSRFSDKLVDLATGRFTQHDFERWGRLWWWRAGEIAKKSGDIRADLAPILSGRPSDLAKEAAVVELPPIPAEVDFVKQRDFKLVHFGGHVLVIVPVEEGFDLHLTARIARERYSASLSLAHAVGGEAMVFTGDEGTGKRALDYLAVVEHLVNKLEWVEERSDADHVARFRVAGLADHPERMDELVGEIAMGRSLLER